MNILTTLVIFSQELLRNFSRGCLLFIPPKLSKTSKEFLEKYSGNIVRKNSREILWNFRRNIPEKFSGTSWQKFGGKNLRIFFETNSQNADPLKNISNWGPIPKNFSKISKESVANTCSWEISRKILKASHQNWRTWGNSSLLLPGIWKSLKLFPHVS